MRQVRQSTARAVMILMVDSTDHVTGKTGLTLTITASKAGGAFASITPTVTERGSGWYSLALTTSHTDTLGDLAVHVTGTAADPADFLLSIVAYNPEDSAGLGLSRVDAAVSTRSTLTQAQIVSDSTPFLGASVASIKAKTDNLPASPAAVGSAMTLAPDSITAATIAAGAIGSSEAPLLANLDATVSSRLATAGYTAPANADITTIKAKTDNLPSDPADESSLQAAIATRAAPGAAMTLTSVEEDAIVDKVWDEPLTGLTHNGATSAGRRVRELADVVVIERGTLQGATAGTATLPATFSAVDGYYDHILMVISGGIGVGQVRPLQDYVGLTKIVNVNPDWAVIPTGADFELYAFGEVHVHEIHEGAISSESFITGAINATVAPALDAAVSSRATAGDSMALTSGAVDAILDDAVEGTVTLRQALRVVLAVLAGKAVGAPDGPIAYRDIGDTKDRVIGLIDGDGNRTSVTLDVN